MTDQQQAAELMQQLQLGNEVGVLMGIIAQKLKVEVTQSFWKDMIQAYDKTQLDARNAKEQFQEMVETQRIPNEEQLKSAKKHHYAKNS